MINIRYSWWFAPDPVTSQKKPMICVCLVEDPDDACYGGIGISICSDSQNPFCRRGRGLALSRAFYACKSDLPGLAILREEALRVILRSAFPTSVVWKAIPSGCPSYHRLKTALFPPKRDDHEQEMLKEIFISKHEEQKDA
ncbi:MAG TPA: hypothetical protein ENI13_00305 [candidate division CPR3 bacterium]|uniref:Uncharacterized protein n=1 Tax=candidate division CPR3 bacterium TaxID=2268181 RepID=A0A7C1NXK3_UNCC3|nr:hypothetical protein [candidate division CPR3 bacterium]